MPSLAVENATSATARHTPLPAQRFPPLELPLKPQCLLPLLPQFALCPLSLQLLASLAGLQLADGVHHALELIMRFVKVVFQLSVLLITSFNCGLQITQ